MKYEVFKEYTKKLDQEVVTENQEPSLYEIIIHNDDFTPMEFVLGILEKFFCMGRKKATAVMMEAHMQGQARCGIFTKDVAETKITKVIDYARVHEHPLVCSMEAA